MTAPITIESLCHDFQDFRALSDIALEIDAGEYIVLLGPSGCGKTTLLSILGGFIVPSRGAVKIGGRDMTGVAPAKRPTTTMFQDYALFPHMTLRDNVAFGLRMRGVNRAQAAERVVEALRLVRLEEYGDRRVDQLSGGQRQRVAMARALVNEPAVLLLDEPLGALDLQLRLQMQEELRRLQRHLGATFVFVTHDQGEAMAMSDRIAVMNAGRLQQVGTPAEIYERPANRFVATFVGHANLIEARLTGATHDGLATAETADGLALSGLPPPSPAPGGQVLAVLRYEKLRIAPAAAGGAGIAARIEERTYMGSSLRFICRTDQGVVLTSDTPNGPAERELAEGDAVTLDWSPADVVLLAE